ncbi:MAG: aminodeoxychorismate synthase component I [Polyangia bacterium]
MKTLLIDNYDSFTYNLFHLIGQVNGEEPLVFHNDQLTYEEIAELHFDNIVLSPGPGHPGRPRDFGVCRELIARADVPLLGVCLGHQGLALEAGAAIGHAPEPVHGRIDTIWHDGSPLFHGVPSPLDVVRYHSLLVQEPLPLRLRKTAWNADGLIMALQHADRPRWGLQFHPESVCTEHGALLLRNFRDLTRRLHRRPPPVPPRAREAFASLPDPARPAARCRLAVRKLALWRDPESVFLALFADQPTSFWLDSSLLADGLSRFSFLGAGDGPLSKLLTYEVASRQLTITRRGVRTQTACTSLFDALRAELRELECEVPELPFGFACGLVGYLGYELKAETGGQGAHSASTPDAALLLADRVLAFDHDAHEIYLLQLVLLPADAAAVAWFDETERRLATIGPAPPLELPAAVPGPEPLGEPRHDRADYLALVARCLAEIRDGESYEICLTNRVRIPCADAVDPLLLYRVLRRINPAPYAAFLRFPDVTVLCSSPERFLRIDRDGLVESKPIKGTRPRAADPDQDARLRDELRTCVKDRAENLMIVDLLRNDLGRICRLGSVHVPHLMAVESYATVHQLVSTIRGRLRAGVSAIDCVRSAFPGGSMTGAPKLRTLEILDRLEGGARGVYSGALGYLSVHGAADLNIVIRTLVKTAAGLELGIGGAVVALSDPEAEFAETLLKARAPLLAVRIAEALART